MPRDRHGLRGQRRKMHLYISPVGAMAAVIGLLLLLARSLFVSKETKTQLVAVGYIALFSGLAYILANCHPFAETASDKTLGSAITEIASRAQVPVAAEELPPGVYQYQSIWCMPAPGAHYVTFAISGTVTDKDPVRRELSFVATNATWICVDLGPVGRTPFVEENYKFTGFFEVRTNSTGDGNSISVYLPFTGGTGHPH